MIGTETRLINNTDNWILHHWSIVAGSRRFRSRFRNILPQNVVHFVFRSVLIIKLKLKQNITARHHSIPCEYQLPTLIRYLTNFWNINENYLGLCYLVLNKCNLMYLLRYVLRLDGFASTFYSKTYENVSQLTAKIIFHQCHSTLFHIQPTQTTDSLQWTFSPLYQIELFNMNQ